MRRFRGGARGNSAFWKKAFGVVAVLGLIALIFLHNLAYLNSAEIVLVTVTGRERITESDSEGNVTSKYLVFTDQETFENTDSLMFGKYNSSDFQGRLIEGKQYRLKVAGWRRPFWSHYRNIVEILGEVQPTKLQSGPLQLEKVEREQ